MARPEEQAPADVFYDDGESSKYNSSSRMQHIQGAMTFRALEILNLDKNKANLILDLGSGSGISGEILTEEGYNWLGMDISPSMISVAMERGVCGDMILGDFGNGVPFRGGIFDAAISISAIQWLFTAEQIDKDPKQRMKIFFTTLYSSLVKGAGFVAQFYPANDEQTETLMSIAKQAGFSGGLVIDNPESKKKKKYYLVLTAGLSNTDLNLSNVELPSSKKNKKKVIDTRKSYVLKKKETMKKRGKRVVRDSKYSGRKRHTYF